jgi:hypothetical protein
MAALYPKLVFAAGIAALGVGLFALGNAPDPGAPAVEPALPSDFVQLPYPTTAQRPAEFVQPTGAPPQSAGGATAAVGAGGPPPEMDPYAG